MTKLDELKHIIKINTNQDVMRLILIYLKSAISELQAEYQKELDEKKDEIDFLSVQLQNMKNDKDKSLPEIDELSMKKNIDFDKTVDDYYKDESIQDKLKDLKLIEKLEPRIIGEFKDGPTITSESPAEMKINELVNTVNLLTEIMKGMVK